MRILLRNLETGLYLSRGGNWINKPELALAFLDHVRAKDYSIYHRLPHTEVVTVSDALAPSLPPIAPAAGEVERPGNGSERGPEGSPGQTNDGMTTAISDPRSIARSPQFRPAPEARRASAARKARPAKALVAEQPPPGASELLTVVEARIDVGMGNKLFIRGLGGGLSWEKGLPLSCVNPSTWTWSTSKATGKVVFKLLLNDQTWAQGEDIAVEAGQKIQVTPQF